MNKLINLGFTLAGKWIIKADNIDFELNDLKKSIDVLYAFVSDNELKYLGKTSKTLLSRMNGYRKPGPTQYTNIRINGLIFKELQNDKDVSIYVLVASNMCEYKGYSVSLAAGLEDVFIRVLDPKWNFHGKKKITNNEPENEPNTISELELVSPHKNTFVEVKITETYLGKFFNVKKQYEDLFGPHDTSIRIQFGEDDNVFVIGRIDRKSNSSQAPRIHAEATYSAWVNNNFKVGDVLKIDVYSPVSIRLYK